MKAQEQRDGEQNSNTLGKVPSILDHIFLIKYVKYILFSFETWPHYVA